MPSTVDYEDCLRAVEAADPDNPAIHRACLAAAAAWVDVVDVYTSRSGSRGQGVVSPMRCR